jgi:NAD kinase
VAYKHIPSPEEIRELVERRKAGELAEGGNYRIQELAKVEAPRSVEQVRNMLDRVIATHDCEPAVKLLEMTLETHEVQGNDGQRHKVYTMPMEMRVNVLKFLTKFRLPELKSVEVKGQVDHKHEIVIVRYGDDGTVKREERMATVTVPPVGLQSKEITDVEVVGG